MWCYELAWFFSWYHISQSGQTPTRQIMDSYASTNIRIVGIYCQMGGQLTDVDEFSFDMQSAGPVEVIPLLQVAAPVIEYLYAVALSICNINPPISVGADAVHQIKLSGIRTILSP